MDRLRSEVIPPVILQALNFGRRLDLCHFYYFRHLLTQVGRLALSVDNHPDFGHQVHGQADVHLVLAQRTDRLDIHLAAVNRHTGLGS